MEEQFTQKWIIISLFEQYNEGTEFHYTDFPLHITLAGVFAANQTGSELAKGLETLLINQPRLRITGDQKAMFGPKEDISVTRVKKSPELMSLYNTVYDWLKSLGVAYNSPEYHGSGYAPHVTDQKTGSLEINESRTLTSLSLIDMFPGGNGEQRKIVKTFELN